MKYLKLLGWWIINTVGLLLVTGIFYFYIDIYIDLLSKWFIFSFLVVGILAYAIALISGFMVLIGIMKEVIENV